MLPACAELLAPPAWRSIDFISDLHLHVQEPANFAAWQHYLATSPADAIFILGDLFEVWVGDDVLQASNAAASGTAPPADHLFENQCRSALAQCAQRKPVYFMHGNRNFLLGPAALQACGMQLLADPTVLAFGGLRYLLSHGDALCLADTDYQQFRSLVRSAEWQNNFLAQALPQRQHMARHMRQQSEARKQLGGPWIDIDPTQAALWMQAASAQHMVHGHTHEGADHPIAASTSGPALGTRHVLCDWQADAAVPRAQVLRMALQEVSALQTQPVLVQRLPILGNL